MQPSSALLGVVCCLWLPATGVDSSSWTADIPSSITALMGSCVVIPCSFDYPDFVPKESTKFIGFWYDQADHIAYHPNASRMAESYRGRVTLLGEASGKNCSLMIDPVRESDTGPFQFRIEITDFNNYSYKDKPVSVTVKRAPDPVALEVDPDLSEGGGIGSASCSAAHTCPAAPPTLTWTPSGPRSSELLPQGGGGGGGGGVGGVGGVGDGRWQSRSRLGFPLTRRLHNTSVTCAVEFRGGQRAQASTVLLVKHTPLNVTVLQLQQQQGGAVPEGGTMKLRCLSDGYPAPDRHWWISEGETLLHGGRDYLWTNVSRRSERVYCSAGNALGHARSDLVQPNTMYPPEVSPASACSASVLRVSCECAVEASPPAAVHLSRAGRLLLSVAVETRGFVTVATLAGDDEVALWSSEPVYCHASNSQGNATRALQVPPNGQVLTITGIVTGVLLLIVMVLLGIKWKRKQIKDNTIFADFHMNQSTHCNKKDNTTFDDAIYANVRN